MEWLESRLLRSARPFVPSSVSFDNGSPQGQGDQDDQAMMQTMCDLVLGEIQNEMDRVEKEAEHRRQEELRLTNQPDYAWLIDWRLRAKRPLGFRESSEVELLCTKVRPGEWRRLLQEWRRRARFVDSRDEVLDAFRQAVDHTVAERMARECRLESVDEHHPTTTTGGAHQNYGMESTPPQTPDQHLEQKTAKPQAVMPQKHQQQRPQTARAQRRVHYPAQLLNVFMLEEPPHQQGHHRQERLPSGNEAV